MAVLGMTVGGATRRLLESAYEASSLPGWYAFARTGVPVQLAAACKLYVSPSPAALADAFPRIVAELVRAEVRSFKVGRGIEGLLRPDKVIAYFDRRDDLDRVADALERVLSGCPAQGVPFTADIAGDGLLSWGVDPPLGHAALSWRSWVTKKLAASLTARRAMPEVDPVAATLDDIRAAGVDPERWLVSPDAFRDRKPACDGRAARRRDDPLHAAAGREVPAGRRAFGTAARPDRRGGRRSMRSSRGRGFA